VISPAHVKEAYREIKEKKSPGKREGDPREARDQSQKDDDFGDFVEEVGVHVEKTISRKTAVTRGEIKDEKNRKKIPD
jgi:hypothetical protein